MCICLEGAGGNTNTPTSETRVHSLAAVRLALLLSDKLLHCKRYNSALLFSDSIRVCTDVKVQ